MAAGADCDTFSDLELIASEWLNDDCNAYGLGRIMLEDISGIGYSNKCDYIFTFTGTPTLPDTGYWWGAAFTFDFSKVKGKYVLTSTDFNSRQMPVKDPRR